MIFQLSRAWIGQFIVYIIETLINWNTIHTWSYLKWINAKNCQLVYTFSFHANSTNFNNNHYSIVSLLDSSHYFRVRMGVKDIYIFFFVINSGSEQPILSALFRFLKVALKYVSNIKAKFYKPFYICNS